MMENKYYFKIKNRILFLKKIIYSFCQRGKLTLGYPKLKLFVKFTSVERPEPLPYLPSFRMTARKSQL
jgi:hypothetical protein